MDDRGFESINVIPFIDIMLVLLTIVLTTSTFIATGAINVKLPKASENNAAIPLTCLTIVIERNGDLRIDDKRIDVNELVELLGLEDRARDILIRADRQLPLQNFVSVMDRVKQLGFVKISLQTEAG